MKKSRKKELTIKNITELSAILEELKEQLSKLQFDLRSGKTSNIKDIRLTKNEIAVILTIIKNKDKNE